MGVVNVTPDSFSRDGALDPARAAERAAQERDAGADFIDFGAESTRPGHVPVDVSTELSRLLPALERFRAADQTSIVSIDTYKPGVFRRAHAAGGDILNSIWGLDDALLDVAVECGTPVIAMHNKAEAIYDNVVDEVLSYLDRTAQRAVQRGLPREHVIVDPGIGFGKTAEHNITLLGALDRLAALGFPTLIGTSRKATIGKLTGRPVTERVFGTLATVTLAAAAGIDVVRVHDAGAARDAVRVTDAIARGWRPDDWSTA
ncbi:MAG: dihydropteroate synthase [Candidatus Eremiobacteraeota bacterium]|nr:dihydropteroate synthase [Candidatus Eremiobacteraeota bacterium]